MSDLHPDDIIALVAKAFVLEAITDKPGCTTRYEDLPGKPLQDYIVAGINASRYFGLLADDLRKTPSTSIFAHNLAALKASNAHKSDKFINLGLLEVMFVAVAARVRVDKPDKVVDEMVRLAKATSHEDVMYIISTRRLAWSTSVNNQKSTDDFAEYESCQSIQEYFARRHKNHPPDTSYYQWSEQYLDDFPILRQFFDSYSKKGEIIDTTKVVFTDIMSQHPDIRIGVVADMCAAAIFLWLSFNPKSI